MDRKTAFIGHRDFLPGDIGQRLKLAIQNEIDLGCRSFIMGTHGNFDLESLRACKSLRKIYPEIKIEVVITSLSQIQPDTVFDEFGVETVMYEIEETHFKRRIIESNRQMIDNCDTLICYVQPKRWRSGADLIMNYAIKKGLKIVNLYQE